MRNRLGAARRRLRINGWSASLESRGQSRSPLGHAHMRAECSTDSFCLVHGLFAALGAHLESRSHKPQRATQAVSVRTRVTERRAATPRDSNRALRFVDEAGDGPPRAGRTRYPAQSIVGAARGWSWQRSRRRRQKPI